MTKQTIRDILWLVHKNGQWLRQPIKMDKPGDYGMDVQEAEAAIQELITAARIEENQSIASMLTETIEDKRECCYNHEKYVGQCYACRLIKWRKIIAKEYLGSIQERLRDLTPPTLEEKEKHGS